MLRGPGCRHRAYWHLLYAAPLALIFACGDGPTDLSTRRPTQLAILTQPPSPAQSGVPFSSQPVVQLQDDKGASVAQAGVAVSASIATGGGDLIGTTSVATASNGQASFTGLGVHGAVGPHTLSFTAPDLTPVTSTTVDLTPGSARSIAPHDGNDQIAATGGPVSTPPSVTVTDADNNPVAGVPVTFQVTGGGGTIEPAGPVTTDASGIATLTSWTLGPAVGANTLTATAPDLSGSPVTFTATGAIGGLIKGTITTSNRLLASAANALSRTTIPPMASFGSSKAPAGKPLRSAWVHPDAGPRIPRTPQYTRDELIVRFRPGALGAPAMGSAALASPSTVSLLATRIRSQVTAALSPHRASLAGISPAILSARVRVPESADISRVAAALRLDPAFVSVERNGIVSRQGSVLSRVAAVKSSNDPLYAYQAWNYGMIDLPEAWSRTTGSQSVVVAVVDDGIRFDHPDIKANLTSDGYDFVSDLQLDLCSGGTIGLAGDNDGYDPDPTSPSAYDFDDTNDCLDGPQDLGNHGLHVAGTIGAVGNDGLGGSGINWTVRIRPVRVLGVDGQGTDYDIAQGILYAAGLPADNGRGGTVQLPPGQGARIINLSLGGQQSDIGRDAVVEATRAGALLVAAAGNSRTSTAIYPAAYPEVLSVSAVGPDGQLASYSSFGPTIDIAAPGGDVNDGNASFGIVSTIWDFGANAPEYAIAQGTSMAVPHVSGVAALLLAQDPGLSRSNLRSLLTDYAVDAGASDRYGAGIVNARNSLARNFGPPRQLRARLYNALTGAAVQTASVPQNGSYSFTVSPGSYQVFAGQDESGDQEIGLPGRRWGAFGGSSSPSTIDVNGSDTHQASFSIALPGEDEPNDSFQDANSLPVGGYVQGTTTQNAVDGFRVLIPEPGQYTFETSAVDGACGLALEEDTILELYDGNGVLLDSNDDINETGFNFCSRVSQSLSPGPYQVRVRGLHGGSYRLQARAGI
jgi:subtilisin family serine protease